MKAIHSIFHVSFLRKYIPDESHVLKNELVQIDQKLAYDEKPVVIIGGQVRKLHSKEIPLVKVIWEKHEPQGVTWELEQVMHEKYLELFSKIE